MNAYSKARKCIALKTRKDNTLTKVYTKTSEAVSRSHPDKCADQIGDAIFDYLRTFKKDAQSAVEIAAGANKLMIFGEIDADIVKAPENVTEVEKANPKLAEEITKVAQNTLIDIGYSQKDYNPEIIVNLVTQSAQINNAVEGTEEKEASAGDQGIVTGYAIAETKQYQSLHFILAHELMIRLDDERERGLLPWLKPDAKSQVTVTYEYSETGLDKPISIDHVLISHCHSEEHHIDEIREKLESRARDIIIDFLNDNSEFLPYQILIENLNYTEFLINPAGTWTLGGPVADSGLSSRKLVVDNYGSAAPIGGGGTSGKNANKVDRSGAYYARHVAKSIVSSGLAGKAQVELGFAIGVPHATSVNIETFGTENIELSKIYHKVHNVFDFKVKSMIELCDSIDSYAETSKHGNYTNNSFPWESALEL